MLKEIVKLQRDFLWGWGSEGRKIAWASWEKVCEPRETGGLDILDLRLFNVAMLGKWIWCLSSDKGGLWKEVLESKYEGWRSLKVIRVYNKDSLWWRDMKGIWKMEDWGRSFKNCFEWAVRNGEKISLWDDVWVGTEDLRSIFPILFSLSISKDAKLAPFGEWLNGSWNGI